MDFQNFMQLKGLLGKSPRNLVSSPFFFLFRSLTILFLAPAFIGDFFHFGVEIFHVMSLFPSIVKLISFLLTKSALFEDLAH